MENQISIKRGFAIPFSVNITSVSTFVAIIAAAVSIFATAAGADISAAISGTVALMAVYILEKKGGDK